MLVEQQLHQRLLQELSLLQESIGTLYPSPATCRRWTQWLLEKTQTLNTENPSAPLLDGQKSLPKPYFRRITAEEAAELDSVDKEVVWHGDESVRALLDMGDWTNAHFASTAPRDDQTISQTGASVPESATPSVADTASIPVSIFGTDMTPVKFVRMVKTPHGSIPVYNLPTMFPKHLHRTLFHSLQLMLGEQRRIRERMSKAFDIPLTPTSSDTCNILALSSWPDPVTLPPAAVAAAKELNVGIEPFCAATRINDPGDKAVPVMLALWRIATWHGHGWEEYETDARGKPIYTVDKGRKFAIPSRSDTEPSRSQRERRLRRVPPPPVLDPLRSEYSHPLRPQPTLSVPPAIARDVIE